MGRFFANRAAYSLLSIAGLVVLVFFLARLTGDPTELYVPVDAPQNVRDQIAVRLGFDQPLTQQFVRYLADLAHGNFGWSMRLQEPALDPVIRSFPATLTLAGTTLSLALLLSLAIGSLAAWRPGSLFDRLASILSLLGASLPSFWMAMVGILVFSISLRLLPTSGTGSLWHWVLPVAVMLFSTTGVLVQVVRSSVLSSLSSAYVKTARAKGLRKSRILFVHALRNAMLPVVTVAGDQAASLLNGSIMVEMVFGLPGVGKLTVDSILIRDFAVIQAVVLVVAVAIFALNILIDVLYGLLDPKVRYAT